MSQLQDKQDNSKPVTGNSYSPGGGSELPDGKAPRISPTKLFWINTLTFWSIVALFYFFSASQVQTVSYSKFLSELDSGNVQEVSITAHEIAGKFKNSNKRFVAQRVEPELADKLAIHKIEFAGVSEDNFLKTLLDWTMPAVIFVGAWIFLFNRFGPKDGLGPNLMSIEKSKAKIYAEKNIKITFADVAGVDEAKEELQEVIDFLKEPERYRMLGAHLPKGILLVGPPGTGKTLLARAVAGEAGVAFFSISGSEFVELYVGVGAARVRNLFLEAQQKAPCIIFIDELDALGRARKLGNMGGDHGETEQTLNQLLVELDGFDPRQGVVLLAATNRPEILDPALLRAGRFDRHVLVDRPDKTGRVQILNVHLKNVTYSPDLDVANIASQTAGFTGADLANLVNEAVLLTARRKGNVVTNQDFIAAIERIVVGLEKKNRLLNSQERKIVAYHESGHALVALSLSGSDPIQKVSIIPRGIGALGYTMQRPTEDRFLMSKLELENKMTVLMGGRAAESIVFTDVSTGAADDLAKATEIAQSMVIRYGMVEEFGLTAYDTEASFLQPGQTGYGDVRCSEETAREIDCAVRALVSEAFKRAEEILKNRRSYLEAVAQELLTKETLSREDLLRLAPGATPIVQTSQ